MSGSTPTLAPLPAPRPGWTAIVGRITRHETQVVVLYPATPAPDAPKGAA